MPGERVADGFTATKENVKYAGKMSLASSANFKAVNGVISEGLITTQLPAASAGASFQAAIISG